MTPSIEPILDELATQGIDIGGLGLAWARVMPSIVIVPAFGLRATPVPVRAAFGLVFAASVCAAIAPISAGTSERWVLEGLAEVARGLPVALAAAIPLWAATMAGGLADALRGDPDALRGSTTEGRAPTTLGIPISLLASAMFLASGRPARVAALLARHPGGAHPLLAARDDIVSGIWLAVALAGPLLAASVVLEIAAALVARAASPAHMHALIAPVRALGTLVVIGIVFERFAGVLEKAIMTMP
jgi:type III secretory pathway component EscT